MRIILAYGLPGSGKTMLLNKLFEDSACRKIFMNYDQKRSVRLLDHIKTQVLKELLQAHETNLDEIYIDYLFKRNEIVDLYDFIDGNVELFTHLELDIHRFKPDVTQCIKNDELRGREKKAKGTIEKMKIRPISSNDFFLSELSTLTVFEHEVYRGT